MKCKNKSAAFLLSSNNDWISEFLHASLFKDAWDGALDIFYDSKLISGYDVVFILGYMDILDNDFLKKNNLNLVIHESSLPYGKGFSPVQWQILQGHNEIEVSLIEAVEKVDSGDIILQQKLILDGTELHNELREKQAAISISIIRKFLKSFPRYRKQKQIGEESFFPRRLIEDGELEVNKSIEEQFNLLRISNNEDWPAFFYYKGIKYLIKIYKDNV